MKYDIVFSCGHKGIVDLVGKSEERKRKLWFYENQGVCSCCYKSQLEILKAEEEKARTEANASAVFNAQNMGYPALSGTDKQVSWAITLRQQFIDDIISKNPTEVGKFVLNYIISRRTNASEWIDGRNDDVQETLLKYKKIIDNNPALEDKKAIKEVAAETTAEPENCTHTSVVEILTTDNVILAKYIKDDDFRSVVKALNYNWDAEGKAWTRKINFHAGRIEDRIAELGHKLLVNGFRIRISNIDILHAAVAGEYENECKRWITSIVNKPGKVFIDFEKDAENIYHAARKLKGSAWDNYYLSVPVTEYDSIIDFAQLYGFKLSPGAKREIDKYKSSITIVAPIIKDDPEPIDNTISLKNILNSSRDVIEDLKDDN